MRVLLAIDRAIGIVRAESEAGVDHEQTHFLAILANFDLLSVVKVRHSPS